MTSNYSSYGVKRQTSIKTDVDRHVENIERNGYSIVDSNFNTNTQKYIEAEVRIARDNYVKKHGYDNLKSSDEHNTVRAPFLTSSVFLDICFNRDLLEIIKKILDNNFYLNQQNIIINPAQEKYNQGHWHRDLPYQHWTSSRPIALNALYCIDHFTIENGTTTVLPGSHLKDDFPSDRFIKENAKQITANKGQYILIDSMMYHKGGENHSIHERVAINNVFTTPIIRQQISIDQSQFYYSIPDNYREYLGLGYKNFNGVSEYLADRSNRLA